MGLETGNYIEDLDPDWPLGSDFKSQGDDHIRLLKKTVQQSFPNIDGEVAFTAAQMNALPTLAGYQINGLHEEFTGNLNTLIKNSCYYVVVGVATNLPAELINSGNVETIIADINTTRTQFCYGNSTDPEDAFKIWVRYYVDAWGVWKLVVDGGAFTTRLAGYEDDGFHINYSGDLNDIAVNSVYNVFGTVANAPADYFASGWGFIYTDVLHNGAIIEQTLYGANGENDYKQWMRQGDGGVWGAWKLVVDGGAFTLRLAGYDDDGNLIQYTGDLNDIDQNSNYEILASSVTNAPVEMDSWSNIVTNLQQGGGVNGNQIIYGQIGTTAYKQWMRSRLGGVWGAWARVDSTKPIGALEFGYDPNGILAGTWTQLPEGTFIMNTVAAADPSGGSNDAVTVAHQHPGIGDHDHPIVAESFISWGADGDNKNVQPVSGTTGLGGAHQHASAGEDGTDKNRPLFIGVEVWQRTA